MKLKKEIFALPKMARENFLAFKERWLPRSVPQDKPWLHHYDSGVPFELKIPDIPLYQFLQRAFAEAGSRPALRYYNRSFSYHHLYSLVTRFASGLQNLGIKPGERVAICLPNIPQFLIAYWAALYIGAAVVLVNPLLSEREMKHQLACSQARVLVLLDRLYPRMARIRPQTRVEHVVVACLETYMPPILNLALKFHKRIQKAEERIKRNRETLFFRQLLHYPPLRAAVEVSTSAAAVLIFTGGVTGQPKAAVLSHRNVVSNALMARAWISDIKDGEEIIMAVLPFSHSYGMTACHHLAILSQSLLILEPRFDVKRVCRQLRKNRVTLFPGVPTMFAAIVNRYCKRNAHISTIRACISGGAPLPRPVKESFERITDGRLVEGYGLSEAAPITHCNPLRGRYQEGSIGLPWPNTEARVVDLRTRRTLEAGAIGELQVRGPQIMNGYLDEVVETRRVIDAQGWLSTGDLAYHDEDGYFFIVDRIKDILFSGGYNVYPSEIERVLAAHPAVQEAAVVAMPDHYYGEVVAAFIVLCQDKPSPSEQDLITFCRSRLAKYKIPRRICVVDELPKNMLGKVLKRELMMNIASSWT